MKLLFFLICVFGMTAEASQKTVLLFGGLSPRTLPVKTWEKGLQNDSSLSSDFNFRGIPYPSRDFKKKSAIRDGRSQINSIVNEISAHPNQEYILVGHSSGSALAIEVAKRIAATKINPDRITLIVLDGFYPDKNILKGVNVKCVTAKSPENNAIAFNYNGMNRCNQATKDNIEKNTFKPYGCTSPKCLHYSLVDSNAKNEQYNSQKGANPDFVPNTTWLNEFKANKPHVEAVKPTDGTP